MAIKIKNTLFHEKVKLRIMVSMTGRRWADVAVSRISGSHGQSWYSATFELFSQMLSKLDQLVGKFVIMFILSFQENGRSQGIHSFLISIEMF